jgi:ferredoxin
LLTAGGNMQVAVTAVGFTTLFFVIIVLGGAMLMGYGRSGRGGRGNSRYEEPSRGYRDAPRQTTTPARPARQARASYAEDEPTDLLGGFEAHKFGVSHDRGKLTVEVNPSKCYRFGFCEHEAPDVFYLESDGRFGYQASVSVDRMEAVISAMDVCPRRAIKVKLPPEEAYNRVRPEEPLQDPRRTIIPIMGENGEREHRSPEDGGRRIRRTPGR